MSYKDKYLKYKQKYFDIKNNIFGGKNIEPWGWHLSIDAKNTHDNVKNTQKILEFGNTGNIASAIRLNTLCV